MTYWFNDKIFITEVEGISYLYFGTNEMDFPIAITYSSNRTKIKSTLNWYYYVNSSKEMVNNSLKQFPALESFMRLHG